MLAQILVQEAKNLGLYRESPIVQSGPLHKVKDCTLNWLFAAHSFGGCGSSGSVGGGGGCSSGSMGCLGGARRRDFPAAALPLDIVIDAFNAGFSSLSIARSLQSVMMLRKLSGFWEFSAINLHNAIHPPRSKVGSPSARHVAKLNRLIPVMRDFWHKFAFGTQ